MTVHGLTKGRELRRSYRLLDYCDEESGVTAIARTTVYTAFVVVQCLARRELAKRGVVPPERLGMDETVSTKIITDLERDGITITELVEGI